MSKYFSSGTTIQDCTRRRFDSSSGGPVMEDMFCFGRTKDDGTFQTWSYHYACSYDPAQPSHACKQNNGQLDPSIFALDNTHHIL